MSPVHTFTLLIFFAVAAAYYSLFRSSKVDKRDIANRDKNDTKSGMRRAFKIGGKYHMNMDLRKSNLDEWLDVDENYAVLHNIRSKLLDDEKSQVIQCLPGSEAACAEVLDLVVEFLIQNFPEKFKPHFSFSQVEAVEVIATNEIFRVKAPFTRLQPLEIAARLAMEDFNILIQREDNIHIL